MGLGGCQCDTGHKHRAQNPAHNPRAGCGFGRHGSEQLSTAFTFRFTLSTPRGGDGRDVISQGSELYRTCALTGFEPGTSSAEPTAASSRSCPGAQVRPLSGVTEEPAEWEEFRGDIFQP